MKLKALTYYSNKMMAVKPNQVFEVDEQTGQYLIKTFPNWFEVISDQKKRKGRKKKEDTK